MASLILYADSEHLPLLCEYAARTGQELGLADEEVYQLQLAVDEACANVVRHAYGGHGGYLELSIEAADGEVQVMVRDWGEPFDPKAVPRPDTAAPLEERPLGGLGLYLMKQVMDRIEFRFDGNDGNTLIMTKRPNGRPAM